MFDLFGGGSQLLDLLGMCSHAGHHCSLLQSHPTHCLPMKEGTMHLVRGELFLEPSAGHSSVAPADRNAYREASGEMGQTVGAPEASIEQTSNSEYRTDIQHCMVVRCMYAAVL
jgi:hypothetical protein